MNGEDFNRLEHIVFNFKEEVKAEFRHQIGIQSENIQHKLDIVVEGHDVLRKEIRDTRSELLEKIAFVDFKLETLNETLNEKIDAVAADLKAHRADTEVHKKVYKVKED
jgi:vacuolar-type H+-ATPase subunit I/STV1